MPDVTPHLGLPLIAAGQAQKHVTHNEALGQLDALVQLACIDKDMTAPPASPAEGDRYLLTAANPTGAWAGLSGQVVLYADGIWTGLVPVAGWLAYVLDERELYVFDGQAWKILRTAAALTDRLGVNTQADGANRLAVKSNAALFAWDDVTPGSGDMRITLNKKQASQDAGFVFQTGWSSRALFGTLAGDDFVLKTSADGASYKTALTAAAATGVVSFSSSPTAPTPAASDSSTRLATTAYVDRGTARTEITGSSYTILASDRTVAVTALKAPCTLALPSPAIFARGATLTVMDESGACSATNSITVTRAGSSTVNGLAAATIVTPYGYLAFQSDGLSKWTVVNRTPLLNRKTFTSVAVASGTQKIADSFTRIVLSDVQNDIGANWDTTNNVYRVPRTGIYQISATLRVIDSTAAGTQYGLGVHTSEEDNPAFLWHAVGGSPSTRSASPYSRLYAGREGDLLRMIAYAGSSVTVVAASLQICLVADAA